MNVPDNLKKLADELKLKEHQRAFIELCFSLPNRNVTEAYCQAYGTKNRKYARHQAYHLINDEAKQGTTKHHMQQYYKALQEHFAGLEDDESGQRIMDTQEWMILCSAIARGEIKDQFGLDPSLADRLKAMDLMGKALGVLKPQQTNVTVMNNPYQKFTDEELENMVALLEEREDTRHETHS